VLRIRCEEGTKEGKSFLGRERVKERRPLKSWAWGRQRPMGGGHQWDLYQRLMEGDYVLRGGVRVEKKNLKGAAV
jgi:hypothetical protein